MKVVEKECHVPAKTFIQKTYIASDGKEFHLESECLNYEKRLAIQNHLIYKSAVERADTFYEGYGAKLFYLSSKEDFEFFKETQGFTTKYYFHSNFDEYGPGWYIYWAEHGGDYPDDHYLKNYNVYIKDIEEYLEEYKLNLHNAMKSMEYQYSLNEAKDETIL